jgi:hypothetical protein
MFRVRFSTTLSWVEREARVCAIRWGLSFFASKSKSGPDSDPDFDFDRQAILKLPTSQPLVRSNLVSFRQCPSSRDIVQREQELRVWWFFSKANSVSYGFIIKPIYA